MTQHALYIGINNYPGTQINLANCMNNTNN